MTSTRCQWVERNFSVYKAGSLHKGDSDKIFAHLMACDICNQQLWQPEVERFRASLIGGSLLLDRATQHRGERWGRVPIALAASSAGQKGRVGHARGLALLGDGRDQRVDVFCHATLIGGPPGSVRVQLPPALKVGGAGDAFKPVQDALLSLLPSNLPPVAVEVALDALGPLPHHLVLAGDSLHLPIAVAAASAWLDLGVRTDRVFTGALRGDGLLLEVGDVKEKLYFLAPGNRLVLPARNNLSNLWEDRILPAADLASALDHAGGPLPSAAISLAQGSINSEVAAVRASLESISSSGIVLAFPSREETGASLWYVGGKCGLVALNIGNSAKDREEGLEATKTQVKHLRESGALSADQVPFPLRAFACARPGEEALDAKVLDERDWISTERLQQILSAPVAGRGYLPFATALNVARNLWTAGGGSTEAWEQALPAESPIDASSPGLRLGKLKHSLRQGASAQWSSRPASWSDRNHDLTLASLGRHLFIAGNPEGGPGKFVRTLAESASRQAMQTVVLDNSGFYRSMAIPANPAGTQAAKARLPGADAYLSTSLEAVKPWPDEEPRDVAPVTTRVTLANAALGDGLGNPPPGDLPDDLWVIDSSRQAMSVQLQLIQAWCKRLAQVPNRTVHPGRPHTLLILSPGNLLSSSGNEQVRSAVESLLRIGQTVGVAVAISVRAPEDLDSRLVSLCESAVVGTPGAAGSWPSLVGPWQQWSSAIAQLNVSELFYRTPDTQLIVEPRPPASLVLPDAPWDLIQSFASQAEGTLDAPSMQDTVMPDEELVTDQLIESGSFLPRVPFTRQLIGYRVALGTRGEVGGDPPDVAAHLVVRRERDTYKVALKAQRGTVLLDGENLSPGVAVNLSAQHTIEVGGRKLNYQYNANRTEPAAWPYVAEITGASARSWPVSTGNTTIGRDRARCQICLPDRKSQNDLIWTTGDTIPEGGQHLTLDAIYVSGLHGELLIDNLGVRIANRSSRTAVYIRRGATLEVVAPRTESEPLQRDNEVIIGQRVFLWQPA